MTTRTSMPSSCSALGSAPTTSASPPVLANGAHSEATKRTLRGAAMPSARSARVYAVVEVREQVVARLQIRDERLGDARRVQLVIEPRELQDVLVDPARGVRDG